MSSLFSTLVIRLAEAGGEESASHGLSYGIGALALALLLGLMAALLIFGSGREHS